MEFRSSGHQVDLPEFLRVVQAHQNALEHARLLYRDQLAPDFNPFDFIEPNEMRLSRILACLLNPKGTHGQGGRFLFLFLASLDADWRVDDCEHAKTQTEVSFATGRFDILVRSPNGALVIENKPGWGEPPGQLGRYFSHLEELGLTDYRLVYLTADAREPPTDSIDAPQRAKRILNKQLHLWGYPDQLVNWLTKCRGACRADRVTVFIDQFSRYIRKRFEGISDMTARDHLVAEVTGSADMVSPAMQIVFAAEAIREKLLSTLHDQISAAVTSQQWNLEWGMHSGQFAGFNIDFSRQCPCYFRVEFQFAKFDGFRYGAYKKDEGQPSDGGVRAALLADIGVGEEALPHWAWLRDAPLHDQLCPVEPNWSTNSTPWAEIVKREMEGKIMNAARGVRDVLDRHGLL